MGYVGDDEADISSLRPLEVVKDDYARNDLRLRSRGASKTRC